jgi:hypothetical protein
VLLPSYPLLYTTKVRALAATADTAGVSRFAVKSRNVAVIERLVMSNRNESSSATSAPLLLKGPVLPQGQFLRSHNSETHASKRQQWLRIKARRLHQCQAVAQLPLRHGALGAIRVIYVRQSDAT